MPYTAPTFNWFRVEKYQGTTDDDWRIEWCDEEFLTHGIITKIQPIMSLYKHFLTIEYYDLSPKDLADYISRVELTNQLEGTESAILNQPK